MSVPFGAVSSRCPPATASTSSQSNRNRPGGFYRVRYTGKPVHLPVGIKRRNATVLSGEADAMLAPMTGAHNLNKAGKIRILAIPSAARNSVIPDVPTMKELGFNADLDLFRGLSVPKGTPDAIQARARTPASAGDRSRGEWGHLRNPIT